MDDSDKFEERPDWDIYRGIESRSTENILGKVKVMRQYCRYHSREALFRDYAEADDLKESIKVAWEVLLEFEQVLKYYGLGYRQCWCWPSLVLIIHDRESREYLTIRGHGLRLTNCDIPTCKLLCLLDALLVYFGAGQPKNFETHIEREAIAALNGSNE